ncbi:MAG: lipopolysaccharide biosynthesis protein [Acidobacteriia bacterium]|nr:lipopolysaccharide biosynthesis protein [Terriglobia bacterium]
MERRLPEVEDYIAILKRRLWWIVVPACVVPIIAVALSYTLAERYTSQTLVLVEQPKVPDNYVRPVITLDLTVRLASMREQILSRSRLEPIIERFGIYKKENLPMEERIERVRKDIAINPIHSDVQRTGGLPGFFISFTASAPNLAQQICSEITSMFLAENLKVREQSAEGATNFIKRQLEDAKRGLDQEDAKLAVFQRKYMGELPGQEGTNLSMLNSLNTQLDATTQALTRIEQDKLYTASLLAQQLASRQSAREPGLGPDVEEQQLRQLESQLAVMQGRYTADHPDVVKLRKDVDRLKKQLSEHNAARQLRPQTQDAGRPESPELQQLRAQVRAQELGISAEKAKQQRLENEIRMYQARIQSSPAVQEQFKQLTRDYQTALQFYNDLLNKKNQSEMATDLERQQQGEQFRIMDPANLPEKPTYPKRIQFLVLGLVAGLALGSGLAVVQEYRDTSLRNVRDITFYMQLPTLASVPNLGAAPRGPSARQKSKQPLRRMKRNELQGAVK